MCYEIIRRRMHRVFFKNCTLANRAQPLHLVPRRSTGSAQPAHRRQHPGVTLRWVRARLRTRAAMRGLLKPRRPHHTSCATAQGLRFCFQHSNRRAIMTIVRYEPWALLNRFQQQFDRAVGESADGADSASVSWIPHVDVREEAERFVVVADVPGVEGRDIEITAA